MPQETSSNSSSQPEHDPYYGGTLGAGIDWSDPNSPLAPFYFSSTGVVATALVGVAFYLLSVMPLMHTDFWSHLKYGEWIVTHRTIPTVEPLCPFTDKERPFFDAMWLSQVVYYGIFRCGEMVSGQSDLQRFEGGVEAIRLLHLGVGVTALGLFAWSVRQVSGSPVWGAAAVIYGIFMILPLVAIQRPQTLAYLPFMGVIILMQRNVAGDKNVSKKILWLFPCIMVLWANIHGSFVIGLLLAAMLVVSECLQEVWHKSWSISQWWANRIIRYWTMSLAFSGIAITLLNPYGMKLFLHILQFGSHPNLQSMSEWQPLEWTWGAGGHWSYLFLAATLLMTVGVTRRRPRIFPTLLVVTFGVWPLFQQRMMAWWAPLVFWIVAPLWTEWAKKQPWSWPSGIPSFRKTALAGLIVVIVLVVSPASHWVKTGRPRSFASALYSATPYGVAQVLRGENAESSGRARLLLRALQDAGMSEVPPQGPIFCSERQGEYLLWSLPPNIPVMMYNHAQLFSVEYWSRCLTVKEGGEAWDMILQEYGAKWIVVETYYHARLCSQVREHPRWKVVLDEENVQQLPPDARLFVAVRWRE
jgi:hypothetical protein